MYDATEANSLEGTAHLSQSPDRIAPDTVEAVLADFRTWLSDQPANTERPAAPVFDLATLVAQFTALRHEVNLQTKTTRTAVEQTATALQQLQASQAEPEPDHEAQRPVVKLLLDIQDALTVAKRQVEKSAASALSLIDEPSVPLPKRPGFLARLFGAETVLYHAPVSPEMVTKLGQQLSAVADGYAMSLRRIEAALPQFGLERITCEERPFDPELMEVVDTVSDTDSPVGTVVEVLRTGYRWHDKLLRYAQVKVAK